MKRCTKHLLNDYDVALVGPETEICRYLNDTAKRVAAERAMARLLQSLHAEHGDRHTFDWAYWVTEIEAALDAAGYKATEHQSPARGTETEEK